MHNDFVNAYKQHLAARKHQLTDEQAREYERFALSNRDRARDFIRQIKLDLSFDFVGKKVLDIGCAYGGFVIESALLGADAHGIEILPDLIELARVNASNEAGNITLHHGNVLNEEIFRGVKFDLIIINDVFEHIFDIELFFHRIAELSSESAVCFFAIPNGESYHSILREGHKFIFGLSLVEPGLWGSVVGDFNIYYRPIDIYRHYFQEAQYQEPYFKVANADVDGVIDRVREKHSEIEKILSGNSLQKEHISAHARQKFELLRQKFERDILRLSKAEICLKYEEYFWLGYASRIPIENAVQMHAFRRS
jgi:2-polyprenyl-3-methyl-5-hydroxy-6-metoxy-1,4-benzoquinol methylase